MMTGLVVKFEFSEIHSSDYVPETIRQRYSCAKDMILVAS